MAWYLLANNQKSLPYLLTALFLLLAAPILIALLTRRAGRKPKLYDFDNRFVEIDFRSIEYVSYLKEHAWYPDANSGWPDLPNSTP